MRKIRVSWEYPDIYTRPDDPYMHEDFEVDEDATPEEIQPDDKGKRQVSFKVMEKAFVMKKVKNTVLNVFEGA